VTIVLVRPVIIADVAIELDVMPLVSVRPVFMEDVATELDGMPVVSVGPVFMEDVATALDVMTVLVIESVIIDVNVVGFAVIVTLILDSLVMDIERVVDLEVKSVKTVDADTVEAVVSVCMTLGAHVLMLLLQEEFCRQAHSWNVSVPVLYVT
jgi:hypothetical protein